MWGRQTNPNVNFMEVREVYERRKSGENVGDKSKYKIVTEIFVFTWKI